MTLRPEKHHTPLSIAIATALPARKGMPSPQVEAVALRLQSNAGDRAPALSRPQSLQAAQRDLLLRDLARERSRRKRAEAAEREMRRALLFKDATIAEVNHRTKNTLQAASALLSLQARASSSAQVRQALLDSHQRLQLLAEVHALLCTDSDSTQTVFMPRLLQKTCDALSQSFSRPCPGVKLEVASDAISLPTDDASVIALLSNEAVTNAYKHAFVNESSGEITVHLHCISEHAMVLRITDTGVGADFANIKGGMGLKLMRILAGQLHGILELTRHADGAGTQVRLTIDRTAMSDR
jgi:two-component sensor histidine kinase